MDSKDLQKRIENAYQLLTQETTTREKFESIRSLIKGINPRLDTLLQNCSNVLSEVEKFQKGEIIDLSAENLPENTEEEKKRKRSILLLLESWKQLQSEVERIRVEFETLRKDQTPTAQEKITSTTRIAAFAKGPLGIITIIAVLIAGFFVLTRFSKKTDVQKDKQSAPAPSEPTKIKVIDVNGKKIPLIETTIGQGSECMDQAQQTSHYHAKDHIKATAVDGTTVADPGGCGFGKVKDVKVLEIE